MQTLTEGTFKLAPPHGLFDQTVILNLFPDASEGARKQLVHRALAADEIIQLKRGQYILSPQYRKSDPHPFVVAALLHSPSHVSLESALWHHGLVPDALYQVSSVTVDRSRTFNNAFGHFEFQKVPCRMQRAGVEAIRMSPESWAFVATPLRARADSVYLRRDVSWERDGMEYLTESLRIEEEDLHDIGWETFEEIMEGFPVNRVRQFLQELKRKLVG